MRRAVAICREECETPEATLGYPELGRYHFCFVRVTLADGQYQGEIHNCLILRQSHDLKQCGKCSEALKLRLWGRQLAGGDGIREPASLMGAVAERFVPRMAAATEPDGGPASQSKRSAFRIKHLKVTFYADGTVVVDSDLRGRHLFS